jgi:hypothetical protein
MRVNLITHSLSQSESDRLTSPLALTIRPASGVPGDYHFPIDREALMQLLRQKTELTALTLQNFEMNLHGPLGARLLGVELSEKTLTEIGYFID